MRTAALAGLVVLALGLGVARAADEIPTPRLDRVDYAHPEKYVDVPTTLCSKALIEKIAGEIHGATAREKLAAVGAWIDAHLKYDASTFDRWRDVDKLCSDATFGGCADHATIFGALSRSVGVPTVWVKSLDLDWIAWFHAHPDQPKSWNGHVFVEVHVDGKWRLYDAVQKILYDDYDVKQRLLPGHRLAYDKGGDPYELVLSTRWEDWKKQTRKFVETLDMALVPVGEGTKGPIVDPPGRVYVAATHPAWQWVVDRCNALNLSMGSLSGNGSWDRWLPSARRGILVVTAAPGDMVLPEAYWALLPVPPAKIVETLGDKPAAVVRKKAADGTDVVELMARDADALRDAIAGWTLDGGLATKGRAPAEPVPPASALPTDDSKLAHVDPPGGVYVVGNNPEIGWVAERCRKLGRKIGGTGNGGYEMWLPNARRGIAIVVSLAGETTLSGGWRALLPEDAAEDRERLKTKEFDVVRKKAADGTDVVLLVARDKDALKAALDDFQLDAPK